MAFVRVPGNAEPDGAEEVWLEGRGGLKLRALFAPALGAVRGSVVLCNGRTEFLEKYFEVIRELQARGFAVFSMDWRGQGLSGRELANPLKGHLGSLDDAVLDLAEALKLQAHRLPRPHVLIAHSMGGGISLRGMQTRRLEMDAALFSAPMWGIAKLGNVNRRFIKFAAAAGAVSFFLPGADTRWRKEAFKKNVITHDKDRHARAQALQETEPRLQLAGPTIGWLAAAMEAMDGFHRPSALAHLRLPVVVLSAEQEALVSNAAHSEIVKVLPMARLVSVPGARHEIMMETDDVRAIFWAEFDALAADVAPRKGAAVA